MRRWLVVAAVSTAMAMLPATGTAMPGRGDGWEGGTMTASTRTDDGGRSGGFFDWLFALMSAAWGEVRSVIVPGEGNGATSSVNDDVDLLSGGA